MLLNQVTLPNELTAPLEGSVDLGLVPLSPSWFFRLLVALVSGFLFGVTLDLEKRSVFLWDVLTD